VLIVYGAESKVRVGSHVDLHVGSHVEPAFRVVRVVALLWWVESTWLVGFVSPEA